MVDGHPSMLQTTHRLYRDQRSQKHTIAVVLDSAAAAIRKPI
ncbi:hypothetical protein HMPREF9412_5773 [Paenibacillus sp. HGF5]|nr:hypothetical protein HMPREF9412_5773 [Paenibacillus sp. HGF5]